MSRRLISRSPDLARLQNEGYEVDVRGAYLLVSHVPYVDSARQIHFGTLVSDLTLAGQVTARPGNHVVHFIGEQPCDRNGNPIPQIKHAIGTQTLADGIVVHRSFSNKPPQGYADYYEKLTRYIDIISAPAHSLDDNVTAKTFLVIQASDDDSVFVYEDTSSSRAGITALAERLAGQVVGIIGLGGTGSYVLDAVAKTPAQEIHLFDDDVFLQHNAFRSPGAPAIDLLQQHPMKVDFLAAEYSRMHRGVTAHPVRLDGSNLRLLEPLNFVFICIDKGSAKVDIVRFLTDRSVSFIDVGMGITLSAEGLGGILRVTTSTPATHEHIPKRVSFGEGVPDEYATNIQIADLNMLNAALAVVKWKKLCGFYEDREREGHSTYSINVNMLLSEDTGI
jgi:molybdopterin/thiamine biosynthesis adenylyltransferase